MKIIIQGNVDSTKTGCLANFDELVSFFFWNWILFFGRWRLGLCDVELS